MARALELGSARRQQGPSSNKSTPGVSQHTRRGAGHPKPAPVYSSRSRDGESEVNCNGLRWSVCVHAAPFCQQLVSG